MQELFDTLPQLSLHERQGLLLLDTCFVLDMLHKHKLHELLTKEVTLLSFTVEELVYVSHHQNEKGMLRKWVQQHPSLNVMHVPVHPGNWEEERAFVRMINSELLDVVPDASDAVLAAAALATKSNVLTKDKHHLFTTSLENFFQDHGINVWKEWKDAIDFPTIKRNSSDDL